MSKKAPSAPPASASTSSSLRIPSDLACLVRYESLRPNYEKQKRRTGSDGNNFWAPPNQKYAYIRDKTMAKLFRWKGGRMTEIPNDSYGLASLSIYGVATVFGQWDDTPHLLAVGFDAETRHVAEEAGGWKVLSFNHIHKPGTLNSYYSFVTVTGREKLLAAPGSAHWIPQLVPEIYDYDRRQVSTVPTSAGLIGDLPILFALPAFSAPPEILVQVLTTKMQPNVWRPHPHAHSRDAECGLVITVYLDPSNKQGSNQTVLNLLQQGQFGPFYGP